MVRAEKLRENAVSRGESFTFETVFSRREKLDFLIECKKCGYYVKTIYMATKNPRINVKRIEERVKSGGHHVPGEMVIDRYYRSMGLLKEIIDASDEIHVYDNSYGASFCVFIKVDDEMILLNKERREKWVYQYIERHFEEKITHDFTVEQSKIFR